MAGQCWGVINLRLPTTPLWLVSHVITSKSWRNNYFFLFYHFSLSKSHLKPFQYQFLSHVSVSCTHGLGSQATLVSIPLICLFWPHNLTTVASVDLVVFSSIYIVHEYCFTISILFFGLPDMTCSLQYCTTCTCWTMLPFPYEIT